MKWSKDFISCENFCDKKSQYLDELEYNLIVWRWGRNFSEIIDGCILWYELNWWEEATLERGPQWWPWWWPYSVPCILLPFTLSFSSSSSCSSLIWPCLCDGGKPSWCISPSFQVLSKESNRENPFPKTCWSGAKKPPTKTSPPFGSTISPILWCWRLEVTKLNKTKLG